MTKVRTVFPCRHSHSLTYSSLTQNPPKSGTVVPRSTSEEKQPQRNPNLRARYGSVPNRGQNFSVWSAWSRLVHAPTPRQYNPKSTSDEPITFPFWMSRVSTALTVFLLLLPILSPANNAVWSVMTARSSAGKVFVGAMGACDERDNG